MTLDFYTESGRNLAARFQRAVFAGTLETCRHRVFERSQA
jgi:hypothetical protein